MLILDYLCTFVRFLHLYSTLSYSSKEKKNIDRCKNHKNIFIEGNEGNEVGTSLMHQHCMELHLMFHMHAK